MQNQRSETVLPRLPQQANTGAEVAGRDRSGACGAFMLGVYKQTWCSAFGITGVVALGTYMLATTTAPDGSLALTSFRGQPSIRARLRWVLMAVAAGLTSSFSLQDRELGSRVRRLMMFLAFSGLKGIPCPSISWSSPASRSCRFFFITAARLRQPEPLRLHHDAQPVGGKWGPFLFMGLIGLIIAMVVNIFPRFERSGFRGFGDRRADLRRPHRLGYAALKEMYLFNNYDSATAAKVSVMGALSLYLNFINMFPVPAALMGDRDET